MEPPKSKVMESIRLSRLLTDEEKEEARSYIRCAIVEFAEMTELSALNINDPFDDGYTLVRNSDYYKALAAFGVEDK